MASRRFTTEFVITGDSTSAVQASRDLQRANSDLDQQVQRVQRSSEEMSQSFESVSNHAARLATVTAATTAAMGAMVLTQTRNIAEQAALARSVGVTVQSLQQWEFAAQAVNLGAGKMGDIFKDTSEKIGDFVATGGGEAADLFERLNLNINELMGMSPDKQLLAIGEALDGVATQGEKIFFMESLANDASRLLPLMENNAALLREQITLADQIGLSMSQSDIDSIEQANQALNELTGLATGFANTVTANWAPAIVSASNSIQGLVVDVGGMGEVVSFATDGTILLTAVMGTRLVGALEVATTKTLAKVASDRALIQSEAAAAAAGAKRTAETLRIAQSEQLAAQRAFENSRATAAATGNTTLRTKAITRLAAANQRAIAAEAAHTAAVNTSSAAMARGTVAAQGMAAASRAGAGALALIGGPLGAAMLAGGAIYYFREELGLVQPEIEASADRVAELTGSIDAMSRAVVQNRIADLTADLQALKTSFIEVTEVGSAADSQMISGSGVLGIAAGELGRQARAIQSAKDGLVQGVQSPETLAEIKAHEEALAQLETQFESLGSTAITIPPIIRDNDAAAKAAAKAAEQQASALQALQQEIDPLLADHQTYIERLGVLDKALAEGTISEEAYGEAIRWSAEQYTRAATGAEDYEKELKALVGQYDSQRKKAQQLAADERAIQEAFDTNAISAQQYARMMAEVEEAQYRLALESEGAFAAMATAWDRSVERMDDAGKDFWRGWLDGTGDAVDQFKNIVMDGVAEVAHALITRPLTVGLTADLQGMLGLGAGAQQGAGGGLNFGNTIGAAKNLWSAGGSLLGGGASTAAAGYSGALGAATSTGYGGAMGSAAAGAATAGGGFMGAASAAMPWVGGAMLVDNVLGLGIVDGIVSGISGLFGGSPTPFSGRFGTRSTTQGFEHQGNEADEGQFYRESALGTVGFFDQGTERLQRAGTGDKAWADELAAGAAQIDNLVASLAQGEPELTAMRRAVQGLETSSRSAADIVEFALNERPRAALEAMGGNFGQFVQGLSGSIEEVVQQAQVAQQAHGVLAAGMDRLNLQFDASSAGAYAAAGSIAEMVGGIENLTSLQSTYFDNFLTEGERAAYLQNDLADSLAAIGLQLPETRSGYRQLVEAQNLNTEAGQRTYAQLLQLAPAFADLVPEMGDLASGARDFAAELSAARDVITTAEDAARKAWQTFDSQSYDQQRQLLGLLGDSEAALAMERERELATIDESLRPHQLRIWALEDEYAAQEKATQAAQSYVSELSRVRDELSNTLGNISNWMDQQNATGGTPGMNLAESGDQFARQLELAKSGDRDALQSITQYADQYLSANDAYNASGPAGQSIKDDVLAALEALPNQVSAEEYLAQEFRDALQQAVDQLPGGIASSLHPLFESIDLDASGLIDWQEFYSVFQGMASDEELRRIFQKLDADGSGTISRLEALNRSNEGTESNTENLEERARDQLTELNGLVSEMTRTTDQFVGLNSTMVSLKDSINALGVAQAEVAKIERERVAAEQAERQRIEQEREAAQQAAQRAADLAQRRDAASSGLARAEQGMSHHWGNASSISQSVPGNLVGQLQGDGTYNAIRSELLKDSGIISQTAIDKALSQVDASFDGEIESVAKQLIQMATYQRGFNVYTNQLDNIPEFATGGVFTNSIVSEPTHFDMGLMGEAGPEAIVPLHMGSDGLGIKDYTRGLPMPDMPMPQFPALGNSDVVQALTDLRNENKQLRADLNRLLGDVKDNTGNTANAVASSASRAEQQRIAQLEEQRAATRAARLKGPTV